MVDAPGLSRAALAYKRANCMRISGVCPHTQIFSTRGAVKTNICSWALTTPVAAVPRSSGYEAPQRRRQMSDQSSLRAPRSPSALQGPCVCQDRARQCTSHFIAGLQEEATLRGAGEKDGVEAAAAAVSKAADAAAQSAPKAAPSKPNRLESVRDELQYIEWPSAKQAVMDTGVVIAIVVASSTFLLALNGALTSLSNKLFA